VRAREQISARWAGWQARRGRAARRLGRHRPAPRSAASALLRLYRHTGERRWLERGARVAKRVATPELFVGLGSPAERAYSRFKGHAGLALVAAGPRGRMPFAMPMFEPELTGRAS
jgi:ribosomal protein S16